MDKINAKFTLARPISLSPKILKFGIHKIIFYEKERENRIYFISFIVSLFDKRKFCNNFGMLFFGGPEEGSKTLKRSCIS